MKSRMFFSAYGGCVDQRYAGAMEAGKMGAVGVIVRSMSHKIDDLPHIGSMSYGELPNSQRIPSAAISTKHADLLSSMLKLNPEIKFYFKQSCRNMKDVQSYNVIGEITGSEFPKEIITVGGHLDSWDLGDGAHDTFVQSTPNVTFPVRHCCAAGLQRFIAIARGI